MTKTIARIIEARPEVDVAPLSDLLGLEYLFDIPLRSLKSSHLRDTANKIGGCCKKGTVNTSEARSVRLLLKWLSPDQREQFDDSGFFDVVGCDSGRRYRIYDGIASPNVYEIDDVGRRIVGLCFIPAVHLPWADVILAQKISLETDEPHALKVARRFSPKRNFARTRFR